jgi:hypothetical protein
MLNRITGVEERRVLLLKGNFPYIGRDFFMSDGN